MSTDVIMPGSFAGLQIIKPQSREATINMLVYGESSVGKTTLVGGADGVPAMRKVLMVDIEKGDLSLRKTPYRPDVVRLTDWEELQKLYHALLAGGHGYRTVIVDSLDEVQDLNIKSIMEDEGDGEFDTPEWKHWNMNQVRMLRLLRNFRDLPMNVIFTSLVKEDKDQKTGLVMLRPNLPGKLSAKVPAVFDNVFYYFMKEVQVDGTAEKLNARILLTSKTPNTVAKNRGSDDLPQTIIVPPVSDVAPTMELIYNGIIGGNQK